MLTPRGNIHRHRLPRAGAIVTTRLTSSTFSRPPRRGFVTPRRVRFIVESFNLCDSPDWRYSWGIHLVHLRALHNGQHVTVAGHYCDEEDS